MPFSGTKSPYFVTITYDGTTSNPSMSSENILMSSDGFTQVQFSVTVQAALAWASGASVFATFFNAANVSLGTTGTASSGALTGGVQTSIDTAATTIPANTAYAIATVQYNGTPAVNNPLSVYEGRLLNVNNPAMPPVLNKNFSFTTGYLPWQPVNNAILKGNFAPITSADGNFDSLTIGDDIELLGGPGGVPSGKSELFDATKNLAARYRIYVSGSAPAVGGQNQYYDLGAPQPTTDIIESLLLDGEKPFGNRASNRTISLTVLIFAPTLKTMMAAREHLLATIDQETYPVTWTPASTGLPIVFDAFRASPSVITYGFNYDKDPGSSTANWALTVAEIQMQALPYGRSGQDGVQQLDFKNGLIDGNPLSSAVLVDDYATVNYGYSHNDFGGGTNTTTISTGNSGTANNHPESAFGTVSIGSGATATYDNTHNGAFGLAAKIATGASSAVVNLQHVTGTVTARQYFAVDLYMTANPAATAQIGVIQGTGAALAARLNITTAGKVQMDTAGANGVITTTNSVALNKWNRIEGYVQIGAASGQVQCSLYNSNGTSTTLDTSTTPVETQTSSASQNCGTQLLGNWQWGCGSAVLSFTYWLGRVADAAVAPIGPAGDPVNTSGSWRKNTAMTLSPGNDGVFGSSSAEYVPPSPLKMPEPAASYIKTGFNLNLTGLPVLVIWLGQSYDTQWPADPKFVSNVTVDWTITDNNGSVIRFSSKQNKMPWGANPAKPVWTQHGAYIPQNVAGFNYANVVGYTIRVRNWSGDGTNGLVRTKVWLNSLSANPPTIAWATTPRSSLYTVSALPDTARSPVSATIQLPAQSPMTQEITKTGTWLVPKGLTTVQAEAWGGGGAGASCTSKQAGGGGGGGEYALEPAISVIPGTQIPVTIGQGGIAAQQTDTVENFTAPGVHKWVCPASVTSVKAELWGAGGAGCAGGGGGGGGEYAAEAALAVTPGKTYTLTVGLGGKANTGATAAQGGAATRYGGNTRMDGDSVTVRAVGGQSPVTGGTTGANGGKGSTNTTHFNGGAGGSSPGAAGGGGGAGGDFNSPGNHGGNSPYAGPNGAYKTGGTGATGQGNGSSAANPGGSGGNGASAPGFPTKGQQPGGGGGGGYTGSVNNIGGSGGDGMIRLSYRVNSGTKLDGTDTLFGQTGLTNLTVTANGGTSAATGSATGGAGGTGSANTTHFNGGAGGLVSGTDQLLFGRTGALFTNFNSATGTAATFTTGVSAAGLSAGTAVALITTSAALDSSAVINDSAGNSYQLLSQEPISGGTAQLYTYQAAVQFPITTSTTLSLTGNATSVTFGVLWIGSQFFHSALPATAATGSSATAGVTYTDNAPGTIEYTMLVVANNSSNAFTAPSFPAFTPVVTNTLSSGTQRLAVFGQTVAGSVSAKTIAATLTSSGWAAVAIPFVATNQETNAIMLAQSGTGVAATSIPLALTNAFPMDASSGLIIVAVSDPAASTVTVADNASGGSNTYTLQSTTAASGGVIKVFSAPVTSALTTANTITVTDGTSQIHSVQAFFLPNVTIYDTATDNTATGTSATAAVTANASGDPGEFMMAMLGNNSTATFTTPAGWEFAGSQGSSTIELYTFFQKQSGVTASSISATVSVSSAWNATIIGLKCSWLANSGPGGSSAGPNGVGYPGVGISGGPAWMGGGKGADAALGENVAGATAALPGGGGSGAVSTGSAVQGGAGGNGLVRLTWQPPLRTFNDFIIHRPSITDKSKYLNPVVDIPPSDLPNNIEYPVASLVPGRNAQFGGTYTVYLINHTWDTPSAVRRISVTVNQYEYKNGPVISVQATRTITPANDIVNGYVTLGEVTLPVKDRSAEAEETYYTVSVHDTNQNDRFQDLIFLDTLGQTVLCNIAPGTAGDGRYSTYYVDEPSFNRDLGQLLGSGFERDRAVSVLDMALATGGPLYLEGSINPLLVYSTAGAPNLGLSYAPRWYTDRLA